MALGEFSPGEGEKMMDMIIGSIDESHRELTSMHYNNEQSQRNNAHEDVISLSTVDLENYNK